MKPQTEAPKRPMLYPIRKSIQLARDGSVIKVPVKKPPPAPTIPAVELDWTAVVVEAKTGLSVDHYPPLHGVITPHGVKTTNEKLQHIKDQYVQDAVGYGYITEESAHELMADIASGKHLIQVCLDQAT